jgi:hypothetical protein
MQIYTIGLTEKVQKDIASLGTIISGEDAFDISHVLVADISNPSLETGFEIGRAESMLKPVLCLKKEGGSHSSHLVENNLNIVFKQYQDVTDIPAIVSAFLKESESQAKQINSSCCGGGCCDMDR